MSDLNDSSQSSEVDVDSILNSITSPSDGFAMTDNPPPAAEPVPQAQQEFEYEWRGQKIREPLDLARKRASMGRDYNHLVDEFRKEKTDFESKRKEFESRFSKYKEIDEFIEKDPAGKDWWDHVQGGWKTRQAPQDLRDNPAFKPVLDKLSSMEQIIQTLQKEREEIQVRQQDNQLNESIQGLRKQYPDLPWDTPSADGKSLELQILEHAQKSGIPTFKAAFLDFYHPQLEKRWESKGREAIAKDTQTKSKLGLLGESQAPKKALNPIENVRGKSYDEITNEIIKELGLT